MISPGAALNALRRTGPRICGQCGQTFTARLTAVYCSNRCRQAAKYQRGKAAKPGTTRGTHGDVPTA